MFKKVRFYFFLISSLKWIQIKYQIYYRIKRRIRKICSIQYDFSHEKHQRHCQLVMKPGICTQASYREDHFKFINRSYFIKDTIDFNFSRFGKLWTYNLNYFEFLAQDKLHRDEGLRLIRSYIECISSIQDGMDPYPISIRIIYWIRFLSKFDIDDDDINQVLYAQAKILADNIEYHLLGNHLLENGFSLLFASFYFRNIDFYEKAKEIIISELHEQILKDGGHFELSPMYHSIILGRLLDSFNLVTHNSRIFPNELENLLLATIQRMLSWLFNMTCSTDSLPLFNDSANGIAPLPKDLFHYAKRLGITYNILQLSESGYRRLGNNELDVIVDVGPIGPTHNSGHGHCDMLSFILNDGGKPILVDGGTSTYEDCSRRIHEKSNISHNTVTINGENQSEIGSAFRFGKRGKVNIIDEDSTSVKAKCISYRNREHVRTFKLFEQEFKIIDQVQRDPDIEAIASFNFHPDVKVRLIEDGVHIDQIDRRLIFKSYLKIKLSTYYYASEFNRLVPASKVLVFFRSNLESTYYFG